MFFLMPKSKFQNKIIIQDFFVNFPFLSLYTHQKIKKIIKKKPISQSLMVCQWLVQHLLQGGVWDEILGRDAKCSCRTLIMRNISTFLFTKLLCCLLLLLMRIDDELVLLVPTLIL
jgi:hypothetical protein